MRAPRIRLGAMFFLEYAALGAVMPILSLYTREHLGFSGTQAGLIQAMGAIAAVATPLAGAILADRLIPARYLLALCHGVAAVAMLLLGTVTGFLPVLLLFLLHQAAFTPTIALTNAIAFHHLPGDAGRYARSRLWGTVGWVAIAWSIGLVWLGTARDTGPAVQRLGSCLQISALCSGLLALIACTLPRTRIPRGEARLWPTRALAVLRHGPVLTLALCHASIAATFAFHFLGMGPFLRQNGVPQQWVMPIMSIAQIVEIGAMLLLGPMLARWGRRPVLLLGALAAVWQYLIFALGTPWPLVVTSIACHGIVFTCFSTTAIIAIDGFCSTAERSGVHQLLGFLSPGLSALLGSSLAGLVMDWTSVGPQATQMVRFGLYWLAPAGVAAIVALVVLIGKPTRQEPTQSASGSRPR